MAHLAKGHHDLYLVGEENTRRTETRSKPSRETWLIFRLDRLMAVRIEQVVEIVESHGALVRPPGAPPHVCGVVNDGRSLTTVVDLRTLYGMDTTESLDNPKILVVQHNGHRYGLTVASVESIVGIEPGAKIRIPSLVANHLDPELKQDLHEVIDSPEHGSVLLLDVLSLMQRLTG
nr:chemotaxis protein CheW [Luteibacter jiangsuensis]